MLRIVFACLLLVIRQAQGWSLVTSRTVHEPELLELAEIYDSQDEYRLNDPVVGLTALKDKKLVSCFVNDYDPLWLPNPSDKSYIMSSQPCDKVNKNTDLATLRNKAGPKIASMCKDLYVFWLAARNMEPPPLLGTYKQESRHCDFDDDMPTTPKPLKELLDDRRIQSESRQENAPPMIGDGPPPMIGDGPPPMTGDGPPPMIGDGPPPMIGDGPPPMIGDGPPSMLRNAEVPITNDGAPPMIGDIPPPLIDGDAPPMTRDGPPPSLNNNGPPPMLKDVELAPPALDANLHSRRDLDVPAPPMLNGQVTNKKPSAVTLADMLKKFKENRAANVFAVPTPDMKTPPAPKFRRYM